MAGATFLASLAGPAFKERGLQAFCAVMATICGLFATFLLVAILYFGLGIASVSLSWLPSGRTSSGSWDWGVFSGAASVNSAPVAGYNTVINCPPPTKVVCGRAAGGPMACRIDGDPSQCRVVRTQILPQKPAISGTIIAWLNIGVIFAPFVALAAGLAEATACFVGMARGRFLARDTVRHLRNFAVLGLAFLVLFPNLHAIAYGADRLVDIAANFLGPRGVTVYDDLANFNVQIRGLTDALTMVYALALAAIVAVMTKAAAIAEDHAQIV
jgi:hypothetical protein